MRCACTDARLLDLRSRRLLRLDARACNRARARKRSSDHPFAAALDGFVHLVLRVQSLFAL